MKSKHRNKYDLETPCLVIDYDILENSLTKVQSLADIKGKKLRPHVKTHKCTTLAKKQIEHGAVGICAAKISEAEVLAKAGIKGILLTGSFASNSKMNKVIEILSISPSFMITVDNMETIDTINTLLQKNNQTLNVLLDIDTGLNRTGVKPSSALSLAEFILSKKNLRLCGIQAYAGHIQHIPSYKERKDASLKSFEEIIPVFNTLKSKVESCKIFSATGTGTFEIDSNIPEITEHQVGSYLFMDSEYRAVELSKNNEHPSLYAPSLKLLTTVISVNQKGFVTVDAGLKSMYKDGAVPQIITPGYQNMKYDWFGDEYGKIIYENHKKAPALGTVLELVTSHCDPTINLFDKIYVTSGSKVIDEWEIDMRGCSQ